MTIQEFDHQPWGAGLKIEYRGNMYPVSTVDFVERLIGIPSPASGSDEDDIYWVRCENCTLLNPELYGKKSAMD